MKKLQKLTGFETLKIEAHNEKFYIYSLHIKTTIGPAFKSIEELEAYAIENYYNDYV